MNVENMQAIATNFAKAPKDRQAEYQQVVDQAVAAVNQGLPALADNSLDTAAVMWYIAELMSQLREVPAKHIGDILTDTSIGYGLGAAKLMGMIPE